MIEMNLHDDPLGDDDESFPRYESQLGELWRVAFAAPSLAIASLVIGFASLAVIQSATDIGETSLFTSKADNLSDLTEIRVSAAIRLVVALIALALAVTSGLRVVASDNDRDDDDRGDDDLDDQDGPDSPLWVRAVAGAGFVVAVVAIILCAGSLIYALQAHAPANSVFSN